MEIRHANIEALPPATTTASCRQKPHGFLRRNDDQALAGGCSR